MKKIISMIFVPSLALLCSCGQSNEEKANRLFVEGAIRANEAIEQYEKRNIDASIQLLDEALAKADIILADYPESNIAVSLLSDSNITFGQKKYSSLRGDFKKELNEYFDFIKRFGDAGELLYKRDQKAVSDAFALFYSWRQAQYKVESKINADTVKYFSGKDFAKEKILKSNIKPEPLETKVLENKDIDLAAFAKDLKFNVDLIVYEKDALPNLLKMSELSSLDKNARVLFESYLPKIRENVLKLTLPEIKQQGFCFLSKIYANLDNSLAVNVALSEIKDEKLSSEALTFYADKLISKGELDKAISLLDFIKLQSVKDDISIEISKHYTAKGYSMNALEVLEKIKDIEKQKLAIVDVIASMMNEESPVWVNAYAHYIKELRGDYLEVLSKNLLASEDKNLSEKSEEYIKVMLLCDFVRLFAPHNRDLAWEALRKAFEGIYLISYKEEKADAVKEIIDAYMCSGVEIVIVDIPGKEALSQVELQKIYLKLAVNYYLRENTTLAQKYMDKLVANSGLTQEEIIVGLLKANRSKEEVLACIKVIFG